MPKALHDKYQREVNRLHPEWSQDRKDSWVYARLRRTGWKPHQQTKG